MKTLTSVHVGSGNALYEGQDFVIDKSDYVHVIDVNKMGNLIDPRFVDTWVSMINDGQAIGDIMQRFAPGVPLDQYSKYRIENFATNVRPREAMKEVIRDGRGIPYIPGSAIKGAIRTAILATLAAESADAIKTYNYKTFEEQSFGGSPNASVFRFLQVGDAFLEGNMSVIATRMGCLNIRKSYDDLHDGKINQLMEVVRESESASFEMKLDTSRYLQVKERYQELTNLAPCMSTLPALFKTINAHTEKLVKEEIDFWTGIDKDGADQYVDNLKEILSATASCSEGKSCVLRIGAGAGWRFTTGAWTEPFSFFEEKVVTQSRRQANKYLEYPFPKTRRTDGPEDLLLGFVTLNIIS